MKQHDLIITARHFDLTDAIKSIVTQKAEKLYEHESDIIRLRIELECNTAHGSTYTAKGHIEIKGAPLIVSETSEDLYKSVDLLVTKLDRKLRKRTNQLEKQRKNTDPISSS